ncbi:MAG: glycosyltransferase [Acidimicrobiales bacterium]
MPSGLRALAVLSMHTSPLAQPGSGDGGGMNVYVRELSSALARRGVRCEVFIRADAPGLLPVVDVEPGFRVHQLPAGALAPVPKERLADLVPAWTEEVDARLRALDDAGSPVDAIHANYWLSGQAGHVLKHELDLPLVSTFHTLDRVKAEASVEELSFAEPAKRSAAEAEVVGCSDAVIASCSVEADQLVTLYGADRDRIEVIAPGVDHAFFAPGDQRQARRAIGFPAEDPMLLFVGRIQPLKGLATAVETLAALRSGAHGGAGSSARIAWATLVVIGGPSGPHGAEELDAVRRLVAQLGLTDAVRFVPPQRHEMLSTFYRAADVCVVPSRSESFGLVALEAAACGLPVVAAAVGGLTTIVEHGRTGFLVEGRSPDDYAKRIAELLGDAVLAARLGDAAARRAGGYTWSEAARRLQERCSQLASRELVACR